MSSIAKADVTPQGATSALSSKAPRPRIWRPEPSALSGLVMALPFILMLAFFVVYPFIRLVQIATGPPSGVHNINDFFANRANVLVTVTTFRDAAIVTAITFIAGSVIAWALRTTQSRWLRFLILAAIFVPFWMGSVVKIYAFSALLGRAGIVNSALVALHITQHPLQLLYTQPAVIVGMVYQMLPYSVLPMYVAFASIDPDLVTAAEGLGASRIRSIIDVVLPLAVPGILATLIINYVIASGFYLTPVLLGGETQPFTANLIQEDLFSYLDFAGASIGGVVLMAGGIAAVILGYFLVGKERLRRAIAA
jgi:putative spermidine/putrescine transport system permease protein